MLVRVKAPVAPPVTRPLGSLSPFRTPVKEYSEVYTEKMEPTCRDGDFRRRRKKRRAMLDV